MEGLPYLAGAAEMRRFAVTYRRTLPGVIVPNYGTGTYAVCALLSQRYASRLRVIGFAHTDEPEYYDHLRYYEPIIHRFVAVSETIRDRLADRLPHRAADIEVRPYGVVLPPPRAHAYSAAGEPIRLLYAGRLVEKQKRISDLLRLVAELGARGTDFTLAVAGEGDDAAPFAQGVAALPADVRRRITLLGRLPHAEMEALWNASDVCVLTSAYEGCSISMLEAMAHGCVPVVTAVSGARMIVREGANGYTAPVGDVAALATAIGRLARARERVPALGRCAAATVAERCAYPDYVRWFEQLARAVWDAPDRAWPKRRPLERPSAQWVLARLSQQVQRRQPRLYEMYRNVNGRFRRLVSPSPFPPH